MAIQGKQYRVADLHELTPRQGEVLLLTAEGKTREETAIILRISPRTVKARLDDAKQRMDVYNTPALISRAWCDGILRRTLLVLITLTLGYFSCATTTDDMTRPPAPRTAAGRPIRTGRPNPNNNQLPLAA